MAKKKPGKHSSLHDQRLPRPAERQLAQVFELRDRKQWQQALAHLRAVEVEHPNHQEVLLLLAELTFETNDHPGHLDACIRLVRLGGADADLLYMLASAHASCGLPVLAQRTFRDTAARFPNHPKVREAHEAIEMLQKGLDEVVPTFGVPVPEVYDLMCLHERMQVHLTRREYAQAREVGDKLLSRWPHFTPARNNVADAWFQEGDHDRAIAVCREALGHQPGHPFTLATLARLLLLTGEEAQARTIAQEMSEVPITNVDHWVKRAETHGILGADQAVLETWKAAQAEGIAITSDNLASLHHQAGVAHWRLGNPDEARKLWRLAIEIRPGFDLPTEHLAEVRRPEPEQHLPWPASVQVWIPQPWVQTLVGALNSANPLTEVQRAEQVRKFVERHPRVLHVVPHLLDRGDPLGRQIAFHVAVRVRTPEMLAALRTFAEGRRGPEALRADAARLSGQSSGTRVEWARA